MSKKYEVFSSYIKTHPEEYKRKVLRKYVSNFDTWLKVNQKKPNRNKKFEEFKESTIKREGLGKLLNFKGIKTEENLAKYFEKAWFVYNSDLSMQIMMFLTVFDRRIAEWKAKWKNLIPKININKFVLNSPDTPKLVWLDKNQNLNPKINTVNFNEFDEQIEKIQILQTEDSQTPEEK